MIWAPMLLKVSWLAAVRIAAVGGEALKILEQFIQLKSVADRVHDSVLQH